MQKPPQAKPAAYGHLPRRVVAWTGADLLQLLFVSFQRVVLTNGSPRQFAHRRYGCHVDAVVVAALEFAERMFLVAKVHLQHIIANVNVQVLFGQSEICCRAFQVAQCSACAYRTLNQNLACAHQQVELVPYYPFLFAPFTVFHNGFSAFCLVR